MKLLLIILSTLFADANQLYSDGNYAEAAQAYEQIIAEQPNSEAYYNLGNAYFKQDELAQAILAYERCLRLDPRNKDAKYNLAFAQSRIIDNVEDNQMFFIKNWLQSIRNTMRETTWMILSIISFLIVLIGALLFALSKEQWLRKTAFYSGLVALFISICACANAGSLHSRDNNRAEAIITQGIVNVKASPDRSGTELFTLHEGTKVIIHETLGEWCNIHVGNNVGWMKLSSLERI
ncbi:MAG: tetratricopeptide repeat protein [Paludibacteraceae bacterium]|nr:tetratricopeptide repeat protein [Paludibacteraceae bacterium]